MKGRRNLDTSWEDLYIPPSYSKKKKFTSYVEYEERELVKVCKDNMPFECRAYLEKLDIIKFVQPFQKAQKMAHSIRPYSKKA